ncbi:GFA family protein [Nitratireductor pacificus]|uniref:Glutathione-dependent formaldehyde-activating protein n=1 Tax=Nitratireductor pacificus pht-3B TaxID=391937 RepID=K2M547_9HYPH|nr:GFA family protein [Nitratireductor pacificus]EKF17256.1 glutathione-dependent formaldehyde-activating protein [Nitratireductor pacificus pht-3B]
MLEASCHCGAVRLEIAARPLWLTECNCSLCRRRGALWLHCHPAEVTFTAGAGSTAEYLQGDRTLAMHHCPTCGCTTHWSPADPAGQRMAVNARLIDPQAIAGLRIRRFDGADSFDFLD